MPKAFYKMLEIKEEASEEDVKKAYRRLVRKYHPDRNPNGKEQFEKITLAYNILSDTGKRSQYDKGLINDEGKDIAEAQAEAEAEKVAAATYEKFRRQQAAANAARQATPKPEQQRPSTSSPRQNSTKGPETKPQASPQQQGPHARGTRPQARPQTNQSQRGAKVQQRQTPRPELSAAPRHSNAQRAPSRNRLFSHPVSCYIFYAESSFSNVKFSQEKAVFVYQTTTSIGILHNLMKNVIAAQHLDKDIKLSHRTAKNNQPEHAFFNAEEKLAEQLISRLAELITLDLIEQIRPVLEEENRSSYGRR